MLGDPGAGRSARAAARASRLFRVNVCLHGDFLLTVHERRFDLPASVAPDGIPVRSERYAVYVALEGMTATLLEALDAVEREIATIESRLQDEDEPARKPRHPPHHPQPALAA